MDSVNIPNSIINIESYKIFIKALGIGFKEYSSLTKNVSQSEYGESACNTIKIIDILTSMVSPTIDVDIQTMSMYMTRRIGVDDIYVAKYSEHHLHILNKLITNGRCSDIMQAFVLNEDIVLDRLISFGHNNHLTIAVNGLNIIDTVIKSIDIDSLTTSQINNVISSLTTLLTSIHDDLVSQTLTVLLLLVSSKAIDSSNLDRFLQWVNKFSDSIDIAAVIPFDNIKTIIHIISIISNNSICQSLVEYRFDQTIIVLKAKYWSINNDNNNNNNDIDNDDNNKNVTCDFFNTVTNMLRYLTDDASSRSHVEIATAIMNMIIENIQLLFSPNYDEYDAIIISIVNVILKRQGNNVMLLSLLVLPQQPLSTPLPPPIPPIPPMLSSSLSSSSSSHTNAIIEDISLCQMVMLTTLHGIVAAGLLCTMAEEVKATVLKASADLLVHINDNNNTNTNINELIILCSNSITECHIGSDQDQYQYYITVVSCILDKLDRYHHYFYYYLPYHHRYYYQ
jgi:hypothetical protein